MVELREPSHPANPPLIVSLSRPITPFSRLVTNSVCRRLTLRIFIIAGPARRAKPRSNDYQGGLKEMVDPQPHIEQTGNERRCRRTSNE